MLGFRPHQRHEAFAHFSRRLVGEGDGKDAAGPDAMRQHPCDAACQHTCLARSRARADEQCLLVAFHRFLLLGVETLQEALRIAYRGAHALFH